MRLCHQGFVIDDGIERFDFERCHGWLRASYWSPDIPRIEVERGFRRSSLVAGAYRDGAQVGCLRLVTDFTRFAYLMDVFVVPECRGSRLGVALVRFALAHPELTLVYKWTLATADAHGVTAASPVFGRSRSRSAWVAIGHVKTRRDRRTSVDEFAKIAKAPAGRLRRTTDDAQRLGRIEGRPSTGLAGFFS